MKPTFISLFAGIGGIDLGLERAGFQCAAQVEIDDYATRVLTKHWPDVPRFRDVRECGAHNLPAVDLIAGGFPCQDISNAGKRAGIGGERSGLWAEFARLISELRPRYVLVENVAALLGRGMGTVLGDLSALGYDAEWEIVSAAAVGAPHLRERVFIVAYAGGKRRQQVVAGALGDEGAHERRPAQNNHQSQRNGESSGAPAVAHTNNGQRKSDRPAGRMGWERQPLDDFRSVCRGAYWETEPGVGRVAHGVPAELDGGIRLENAHETCFTQARTARHPIFNRVRTVWQHTELATPSSRHQQCVVCGYPLSGLPYQGRSIIGEMGSGAEEAEDLFGLRQDFYRILAQSGQDLQQGMFIGSGQAKRPQKMAWRVDRLRGLGNAVVPQVAEFVGRLIYADWEKSI